MSRRILAVAGSAVLGLIGAVTLASPASAHHTEVAGSPVCDTSTGEWVVTWTVNSFAPPEATHYRLLDVQVTPAGSSVSNIAITEGEGFPHASGVALEGEQRLPGNATSASLGVRAKWSNGFEEENLKSGEVVFEGTCEKPPAELDVNDASSCDELTVTVASPAEGAAVTVQVTTSAGDIEEFDLEPGADQSVSFPAADGLTYQVTADGAEIGSGEWTNPGDCEVEIPVAHKSDCDSLTIEITNPLEDEALEASITSGDVTETLTIQPGEAGEVSFDAEEGTVATVAIEGAEPLEIAWEQPDGCDGGGGGLPVTGAPTGVVIGAALALLAVGGGLFLLARRRRITFTA